MSYYLVGEMDGVILGQSKVTSYGKILANPILWMLKLKLQYFGHLMRRTDSLEKTLMLGKIEGRRRGR